jgi:hypothetical protein
MTRRRWPTDAKVVTAVLVGVLLVEAAVLGRNDTSDVSAASATTITAAAPQATTSTTSASTVTTAAPVPATGTTGSAVDLLTIAPPGADVGYDRDLFVQWVDADGDGCNTRCEVLDRQRRIDLPGLPNGGWLSSYDGYTTADTSELDVDHVVPLHEAWLSGASSWDAATRTAFANDLDSPELLAVTPATNRSKGDQDPASWQPPNRDEWCAYAAAWVRVKARWQLTADEAEIAALRNMLNGCPA